MSDEREYNGLWASVRTSMRFMLRSVCALAATMLLFYTLPLAAQVPSPQINLSGNVGAIGFPILNSGTYQMPSDGNVTFAGSNVNTSAFSIKITSAVALTTTRTITYPTGRFTLNIENATTGGQTLAISFGSGATCSIANGSAIVGVWFDGTNCVQSIGSTAGVNEIIPGTNTNCSPLVSGSCTGIVTITATGGGTSGTAPVQLATTGSNISLSGEQTIDGVLTSSSRVLVKDQTTQTQNGVYVSGSGAWTRASDFASPVTGNNVYVTAGSTNFDTVFAVDTPNPITVGSSQLTFRPEGPYAFVYPGAFPCDIVAAGGQTCKAAYSLVRRMFASYSGYLYQVTRASDSTTTNVGTLSSGLVNIATETAFCAGTTCTRSKIYDQTGTSANDLIPYSASPEYYVAVPSSWTTMPSGLVLPINRFGMTNGYATASGASGLPSGNSSITVYMLAENYSEGGIINGCCGLFNQSENPVRDAGMGKMFGAAFSTGNAVDCVNLGTGTGPWAGVDLEEGVCLYGGTPSQNYLAVLGKYNTSGTTFAVKSSDITQGRWTTVYNAGLPAGYTMNLEQNVTLGMGGDGTPSPGNWMEGAIIAGTTSDATDNALQGNFVSFFGPAQTAVPNTVRANLTYSINGYTSPATTALPAKGLFLNQVVYTTNAASYSDCTAGAGTTFNACRWNGTIWTPLFPTGGSMVWPTFTGLAKYGGSSNWVTPTYADVVALFGSGSCSGYLKNDGTCSTTSGMVWPSSPGYALWQSGSSWSTPSLTDSGGNVNSSEPIVVNASSVASQLSLTYNTGHALVPGSSTTVVSGPDASGKDMVSEAGGTAAERCNATNAVCGWKGMSTTTNTTGCGTTSGATFNQGNNAFLSLFTNCTATFTFTLPATQPSGTWFTAVEAQTGIAAPPAIALAGGATWFGGSTVPVIAAGQTLYIFADTQNAGNYVGYIVGASGVATIISSGAITVTAQNTYVICTTTCTVTPLAPAANVQLCVQNDIGVSSVITLAALGSGKYYGLVDHSAYGTANHTLVSGGAVGDQVCLTGKDTTHYNPWAATSDWTGI